MRSVGIAVEVQDRATLSARFPTLAFPSDTPVEGLFEREGGFVDDPARATADVARAARAAGVTFHLGRALAEVEAAWCDPGLETRGVRLRDGERMAAPVVVNCSGPHSGWLNLVARSPLPLATAPLRQVVVDGRAHAPAVAGLPVIADLIHGFYLRPDPDKIRIGAVWPRDETEFLADPDGADLDVAAPWLEARIATAQRRVPGLDVLSPRGLVGVYDVTVQDWYPIVDRTDTRGYFVAIGTSGAWFKAGPVIGGLAAELVSATLGGRDTDRDPLSVPLPITGRRFPMSLLSRRRSPIALSYGGGVLG
jgi:sarcosine oxidase subunit beta